MSEAPQSNRRNRIVLAVAVLGIAALAILIYFILPLEGPGDNEQAQRDEYFIDDQIIVIGENLDTLPADVNAINSDIELTLREGNSLSLSDENSETSNADQIIVSAALQGVGDADCAGINLSLQINLYDLTGTDTEIESARDAITTARSSDVIAEPNWIVGTPWSPTGSPWSPTGSSGGGDPTVATQIDFEEQWAFEQIGLNEVNLPDDLTPEDLPPIKIAIFDTSAMEANGIQSAPARSAGIAFFHPQFVQMPPTPEPGKTINVANHGFFGTGFIKRVAPTSEIEIIRVLTTYNRGDVFTLNRELLEFLHENANAEIKPIVNLSFGIPHLYVENNQSLPFNFSRNFESLEKITRLADCLDIVVIAASGNESADVGPLDSNYPAAWDWVLGVTASSIEQSQSCYANNGDVAAPGGNGGRDPEAEIAPDCAPSLTMCNENDPSCPYGVVGPVHPDVNDDQYHFWVGTSFATPIVTGLAALVRQTENALGNDISAMNVREAIVCGSSLANETQANEMVNIVHIPSTFACLDR